MTSLIFNFKIHLFANVLLILMLANCTAGVDSNWRKKHVDESNAEVLARINTPETRKEFISYLNNDEQKAFFLKHRIKQYEAFILKEDTSKKQVYPLGSGMFHSIIFKLRFNLMEDGTAVTYFFIQTMETHFAEHIYRAEALGEVTENLVVQTKRIRSIDYPIRYTIALIPKNFVKLVASETPVKLFGNLTIKLSKEDMQYLKKFFEYIIEKEQLDHKYDFSEFDLENIPVY